MSNFKQATKVGLRFKVSNGLIATEDLWGQNLTQLDNIAKSLRKELREADDSFIGVKTVATDDLELKLEVVKEVIASKLADRDAQVQNREKAARRNVLLEAMAAKDADALKDMSREDMEKELKSLQ